MDFCNWLHRSGIFINTMRKALFPGTFDPPTFGHLDVIRRSVSICDRLYIGIAINSTKEKSSLFSPEERGELLRKIAKEFPHVEVVLFEGLVVDFAREHKIDFLIRGLRAFSDFEYEFRMALMNRAMSGIETVFLMADPQLAHLSSTLIREVGHHKMRLHSFIPEAIEAEVFGRIREKTR
jgi:pantetheine-phosphate adenylyltransferase